MITIKPSQTMEKDYSHRKFVNTHYMTRDAVVPFYINLIVSNPTEEEVKRVNDIILSKWSPSGLLYIKDKAWREVTNRLNNLIIN